MSKFTMFLASAASVVTLAAPVLAQDTTADTVVATINGTDITVGHMIITRAQLPQQYQQFPPDVLFSGILDQLIQQTLLSQSLKNETDRMMLSLENERRSLRAGEVITNLTGNAVTEEAIQAAYDARFSGAEPETEYNASHILVETLEEAVAVQAEIEAGADFAEVAAEKSTGPSGPNGGQLGWFGPGMMVAPFEAAVVEMEVGTLSGPVETQFGFHIITLNETRVKEAPAIETLRPELEAELQQSAIEDKITELREAAEITQVDEGSIDPTLLTNLELLEP
ncbi:peptidylprolyl isomerase [Thalassobium sp. R2A62]|jgi:peptidyl-prolyl cis-trans isomerase C|uniref:peptidylprolyl isomerase n=1 Tax=Thalassobium sp. R2A62 TaxID=633131 RepID=UPI0001B1CB31|nr:peptidylprolyl isomerase [Thalassobium sp. R2A62]EET47348.1 ppic-type ppiase domain protein [Thalassobium sp. R2A62]MDG1340731.1 peptidylprolyl isomerase [Paracoccaceae bacterium]MDG2453331.1 peptidylprolyl isomerase [Paracoccaceae bacterium]